MRRATVLLLAAGAAPGRPFWHPAGPQKSAPAGPAARSAEDREPPQIFYLEFDGGRVPIELDKPLGTDALGGVKAITLRAEAYRVFPYGGVRFNYPREYTFEADLETKDVSMWTLSGNDCKILVQRYRGQADHRAILESVKKSMLARYKDPGARESAAALSVRGADLEGRRIEARVATTLIRQDLYSAPAGPDTVLLILQDSPREDGEPSADWARAERMFRETMKLPGK
ncbi:MAG TPA: hypothetical protein VM597_00840 [Gemmataceae bacterium]|nr:hypothetical protein [Gemmataceae bacterium]